MSRADVADIDAELIKSRVERFPCTVPNWISCWQHREYVISNKRYCLKRLIKHKLNINDHIHALRPLYMSPHRNSNPNVSYAFMSPSLLIASNSVIYTHNIHLQKTKKNQHSKLTGIKDKWRNGIMANIHDPTRLKSLLRVRLLSEWQTHLLLVINRFRHKITSTHKLYQGIYSKIVSIYGPLSTTLSYHVATTFAGPKKSISQKPISTLGTVDTLQASQSHETRLVLNMKDICSNSTTDQQYSKTPWHPQKEAETHSQVIRRLPAYRAITEEILNNTNWNNVTHDRGSIQLISMNISKRALNKECLLSPSNVIPIDTNENLRHWPDFLKIVDIESKGVYLCIRYGYDEEKLFLISMWVRDELPDDVTTLVIQYYMKLRIKAFIFEPMVALKIAGSVLSFEKMRRYKKWVAHIQIMEFDHDLIQIADDHGIDVNIMKRCFDENDINYSSIHSYSRKSFTKLLHEYGISAGKTIKIFRDLSTKYEIEILPYISHE